MDDIARRSGIIVAVATLFTVLTQIAYLTIQGEAITANMIWGAETIAFLGIALFALVPAFRGGPGALGWAGMALFGLLNLFQSGMGLMMFGPLQEGGDALAPVFAAVLAMAFLLFFAAKAALGIAAIAFGLTLFSGSGGAGKVVGALAALAGLAALVTNLVAMIVGRDLAMVAGGAGTAAALLTALTILMGASERSASH